MFGTESPDCGVPMPEWMTSELMTGVSTELLSFKIYLVELLTSHHSPINFYLYFLDDDYGS